MKTIEFIDGKSDLNSIARDASYTGETVTVTRQGRPYVDIVPHQDEQARREAMTKLFADVEEFHRTHKLPPITMEEIQSAKEEGRR